MWTADNSVRHHDGPGSGGVDEREHFFRNAGIVADVGPFGEPASKVCDVDILSRDDPDGELGGTGIVRAIERDGGDREPRSPLLALLRSRLRARSSMRSLSRIRCRVSKSENVTSYRPHSWKAR